MKNNNLNSADVDPFSLPPPDKLEKAEKDKKSLDKQKTIKHNTYRNNQG